MPRSVRVLRSGRAVSLPAGRSGRGASRCDPETQAERLPRPHWACPCQDVWSPDGSPASLPQSCLRVCSGRANVPSSVSWFSWFFCVSLSRLLRRGLGAPGGLALRESRPGPACPESTLVIIRSLWVKVIKTILASSGISGDLHTQGSKHVLTFSYELFYFFFIFLFFLTSCFKVPLSTVRS